MLGVVNIGAMQEAVDRLANIQPVAALGMTEEIHEEIHEAITKGLGVIESGGPFQNDWRWLTEHGFLPSANMKQALGYHAERVLIQAWVERAKIQAEFDCIDQLVTVIE